MFSQSTDNMGLTDIEMAQFDYDDPYYDERQYDVEYEVSNVQTVVIAIWCWVWGVVAICEKS